MRLWLVGLSLLVLIGCMPGRPAQSPSPDPEDTLVLAGQIVVPQEKDPTTGQTAPSASPTPSPSTAPYTPFAIGVTVTSNYQDLNVAPPPNKPERYRCTALVSAQVTMSNGYHTQAVDWESSNPGLATVDSFGIVRGVGTQAGTVSIIASSRDRKASGSITLQVTNLGDAELVVD